MKSEELVDIPMLNQLHSLEGKEVIVRLDEPEFGWFSLLGCDYSQH